jgi:hypothetical protein
MLFSNIFVYLQVLVLFFVVPLFGVVLMGMLWKQATRAGGFWGLLLGTLASIAMFLFAHWFPLGYTEFLSRDLRDLPALSARLLKPDDPAAEFVAARLSPQTKGLLHQFAESRQTAAPSGSLLARLAEAIKEEDRTTQKLKLSLVDDLNQLLADPALLGSPAMALLAGNETIPAETTGDPHRGNLARANRLLLTAVFPRELARMRRLEATQINPRHAEILAMSPKAKDAGVNSFVAWWSLCLTIGTVLMVSLFTTPKADSELKDLVFGLTALPDEGPCPFYRKPAVWAAVVFALFLAVNVYFW